MIRPVRFRKNEETAVNNYFQEDLSASNEVINAQAQKEFDTFVGKLRSAGVQVITVDDIYEHNTPDSIFPNNWISFHENGNIAVYPMFAENRRKERREDILEQIEDEGFVIESVYDYTEAEQEGIFLEGTGSMILDRVNRKAYCSLSPRADEDLFVEFCEDFEFSPVIFKAYQKVDGKSESIYHTNVMMAIAETFAVICLDAIEDKKERKSVVDNLTSDNKEIIAISLEQMNHFAGNMLQVSTTNGIPYLVMSEAAYKSLSAKQIKQIEQHCTILYSDLQTIETCGGGSARCMMAEVFLPKKS